MTSNTCDQNQKIALHQLVKSFDDMPFNRLLGFHLDSLTENRVTVSFNMQNDLVGNFIHGILHGGVISSVLDITGGMIAMTSIIYRRPEITLSELPALLGKASTIDLSINYLRPGKGERFIATSTITHSGNRICFTQMELCNQEDKLIARATGTYHVS